MCLYACNCSDAAGSLGDELLFICEVSGGADRDLSALCVAGPSRGHLSLQQVNVDFDERGIFACYKIDRERRYGNAIAYGVSADFMKAGASLRLAQIARYFELSVLERLEAANRVRLVGIYATDIARNW